MEVLKKIFAALAGALALISVPPTGEAERPIPIVLDLSQNDTAVGEETTPALPVTFVWPLNTM